MSEAEFRVQASASSQSGTDDAHELMKQQLRHEKHARQEMLKLLDSLRQQRDTMSNAAGAKRTFLANLQVDGWGVGRPQTVSCVTQGPRIAFAYPSA